MDTSNTHATQLARKFLDALFPDIPEGLFISLFTLPGEGVSWHASAESASTILDQPSGLNTYFGVALHDRERARSVSVKSRGTAQTSGMIGGLWGDIDIIGPGHAATNLPLNEEEALWLISKMALPPSAIVRSGGGLQPWWFFKEPWVFESDKDRSEAAALAASWIGTMQSHAAYKGWKVDSTKDLARVLRLPGSCNCKIKGDPKFVTVELFDRRYDPGDFREHLEVVVPVRAAKPIAPGTSSIAGTGDKASDADVFVAKMCMKSMGSTRAVDRDNWIGVGMALKSMGRQELFSCWDSFSRLCSDKYDEQDTLKTWDSFRPIGTIGLGSLIHWARSDSGQVVGYDDVEIGSAFQHAAKSGRSIEPTATITNGESSSSNGVHPEPAASSEPPSPPSPKPQPEGSFQRIRLANVVDGEYLDADGKTHAQIFYMDLPQIQAQIYQAMDNWPRRVGGLLFVDVSLDQDKPISDQHSVQWLRNSDELFAWLGKRCDIRWTTKDCIHPVNNKKLNPPSQKIMFEYLQDNGDIYEGIEALPHVPPVENIYYLKSRLPAVEDTLVTPLIELVSRFNPETEMDRELMIAALLTPGWGGPCGTRPAFVFTSSHGRGCVAGETRVWDEMAKAYRRIDEMYADGISLSVCSLDDENHPVEQEATAPFIKGVADLFEVITENGNRILVTDEHRFLTPDGWRKLADLHVGKSIGFSPDRNLSWTRIRSIKFSRRDVYYDLTVPETENYLAEGLWNHNTGKSATATVLSEIWGGAIGIGANEDWDQIKKRLLGDGSLSKRICLIDNLKGKFHGGDIEGMITAKNIDGWKPYLGQASRQNMLTWYFTANSPSLSRDLADRSVIIQLGKQKHESDFIRWANDFIPANRAAILSEIYQKLNSPPRGKITIRDRWGAWQDAVLSRCGQLGGSMTANHLAKLIIDRRPEVDSDADDADDVLVCLKGFLSDHFPGYRGKDESGGGIPEYEHLKIFINRQQFYNRLVLDRVVKLGSSPRSVIGWVREQCLSGSVGITEKKTKNHGRGWLWIGSMWKPDPNSKSTMDDYIIIHTSDSQGVETDER